jgi:hypothetical protein
MQLQEETMTYLSDRSPGLDLASVVTELATDPLYQLSTAGQELFHTNMLFWLATQHPAESTPVWLRLGVDPPTTDGPDPRGAIRREWRHIDLYVDAGMPGRKLVLENKILAIATPEQLARYRETLMKVAEHRTVDPRDQATSWRLLTLLPPTFSPPRPWEVVTYDDLIEPLEQTAATLKGDTAALVRGYARLVARLVRLTSLVDLGRNLDEPVQLAPDLAARLHGSRLFALVRKLQAVQYAAILDARLAASRPGAPHVGAGLTRGDLLVECFAPTRRGRQFGWQVQNGQARLAMITGPTDPRTVAGRDKVAAENKEYFEFDLPEPLARHLKPFTGRKQWLGYGHEFVYRYAKLRPGTTWRDLIDVGEHLTTRSVFYAERAGT